MRWSKHADILAYMVVIGLIITGVFAIIQPGSFPEGGMYYFICAFFVLMFIFSIKRSQRFFDRDDLDKNH